MTSEAPVEGGAASPPAPLPRFGVAGSAVVSLVLTSSIVVVPPIGVFIAPLGLIPVAQHVAAGRRSSSVWWWVVVALGALSAARAPGFAGHQWYEFLIAYTMAVVVPSISLELWRSTGCSEGRWVAVTTAAGSLGGAAAVVAVVWPLDPVAAIADWGHRMMSQNIEMYRDAGVTTGQIELAADTIGPWLPWIVLGVPLAYLVFVLFWIRTRVPLLGFPMPVARFEDYRGEQWLPAAFVASGLATLLLTGSARWVAAQLLVAVLLLYFVQGLAIIRAHLARWVGGGWLVRWGVGLLCVMNPAAAALVATLGMADGFFPVRPRSRDDGGEE